MASSDTERSQTMNIKKSELAYADLSGKDVRAVIILVSKRTYDRLRACRPQEFEHKSLAQWAAALLERGIQQEEQER